MTIAIVLAVALLCMAMPALAQAQKNLWQTANDAGTFKTWVNAADAAGFKREMVTGGPFTVFMPTDDAFSKLPAGKWSTVSSDKYAIPGVMNNHMISGKYTTDQLVSMGTIRTLDGRQLKVTRASDGTITIGNAKVVKPNVQASNGMIQGIDTVLMP